MSRYKHDSIADVWVATFRCFGQYIVTQGTTKEEAKQALRYAVKKLRHLRKQRTTV